MYKRFSEKMLQKRVEVFPINEYNSINIIKHNICFCKDGVAAAFYFFTKMPCNVNHCEAFYFTELLEKIRIRNENNCPTDLYFFPLKRIYVSRFLTKFYTIIPAFLQFRSIEARHCFWLKLSGVSPIVFV